jgi:hypothetical protein
MDRFRKQPKNQIRLFPYQSAFGAKRMNTIPRVICVVVLLALLGCEQVGPSTSKSPATRPNTPNVEVEFGPGEMNARDILARVAQLYAKCKTYADEGRLEAIYESATNTQIKEVEFQTAYERGKRFRFEWWIKGENNGRRVHVVIFSDSDGTVTWEGGLDLAEKNNPRGIT